MDYSFVGSSVILIDEFKNQKGIWRFENDFLKYRIGLFIKNQFALSSIMINSNYLIDLEFDLKLLTCLLSLN